MLDRQERADQINAQHLGPFLDLGIEDRAQRPADPGIGEKDVEPAMVCDRSFNQRRNLRFVTRVASDVGAADIRADHCRAFAPEQLGRRLADARAGAGSDRDFVGEAQRHAPLPLRERIAKLGSLLPSGAW